LKKLVRQEIVERVALPMPDVKPPTQGRSNAEQLRLEDWTGFELRSRARMRAPITPLEREERWRRQDEALEREWRIIPCGASPHTSASYDMPENAQTARVNRARRALAKLNARDAKVLAVVFGQHHVCEDDELEAVRALVGGDDDAARASVETASQAYREANRPESSEDLEDDDNPRAGTSWPLPVYGPGEPGERQLLGFTWMPLK
ncbi:MAG: hypothetical protein ACYDC2_09910, partial [Solirubrobacteraceae bacterium]